MKKKLIYFLLFAIACGLGVMVYEGQNEPQEKGKEELPATDEKETLVQLSNEQMKQQGLKTETAAPETLKLTLTTRGKIILDPDRVAHVFPKVAGIAVDPQKSMGDQVREGEILAILESQEMANLKAAYLAALSREKLAALNLQREEGLYQKKITPQEDYLKALQSLEEEKINLTLAKQKLQAFGLSDQEVAAIADAPNLRFIPVFAPINGTVIKKHLTKGEYVDDESLIYEIADLHPLFVEMSLYPKDLQRIKEGQEIEITDLENGMKSLAQLTYISPLIEEETIAAKAYAQLHNREGKWRPGTLVQAEIAYEEIDVPVAVCPQAIQKVEGVDCAFIRTDKGFVKREVKLGRVTADKVEIISGIAPGERYISENSFLVKAEMNKDSAKDED